MARHRHRSWANRTYKPHRELGPAGKHQRLSVKQMRYIGERAGMSPKQAYKWAYLTTYESGGEAGKWTNPGQVSTIDAGVGADMATPTAWMQGSGLYKRFQQLGGRRGQRNPRNAAKLALYDLRHGDPGWRMWTTGVNGTDPEFAKASARAATHNIHSVLGRFPNAGGGGGHGGGGQRQRSSNQLTANTSTTGLDALAQRLAGMGGGAGASAPSLGQSEPASAAGAPSYADMVEQQALKQVRRRRVDY